MHTDLYTSEVELEWLIFTVLIINILVISYGKMAMQKSQRIHYWNTYQCVQILFNLLKHTLLVS